MSTFTPAAGERRAFVLDAGACSGCKACQMACRDRHDLPAGVQWRRVYEVTGGGWRQQGRAWVSDVFAWHLSIACNHCERPVCVEVCPSGAMRQRADGIVLVDEARCLGCGYCAWACPYGAPQRHPERGTMTKCTLCVELLDAGGEPACVAACPLRSLTLAPQAELEKRKDLVSDVVPLPSSALTQPALRVRPHAHSARAGAAANTRVANREELPERTPSGEPSLVAFTLLAQLAAGLVWAGGLQRLLGGDVVPGLFITAALALAAAVLASLFHLGRPLRAWRALAGVRRSWLSREILLTGVFAGSLCALLLAPAAAVHAFAAAAGAFMVYAMAAVYRLPAVPAWNRRRTMASFLASAVLLGTAVWWLLHAASRPPHGDTAAAGLSLALVATAAVRHRNGFYHQHR